MEADISTRVAIRAARRLLHMRAAVRDRIPFGPMVVKESDRDVAQREMSDTGISLDTLAKKLKIKET